MDCSMPGFPVLPYLPGFAQTYVNWVSDAILPICGVFLKLDILTAVQRYLLVFLICIFLMISDAEHLSMCLLASCIFPSGKKCLFRSFADFSIELFGFLTLSYMSSLYILDPLSDIILWKAVWTFLKKLKIELPYDPAIPLLSICTKRMKTLIWKYIYTPMFISIVQPLSHVWLFVTTWTAAHQVSLSITNSQRCSNSCPSSRWCHPTISFSVIPFSSHGQSFPASGSFPMSQFFTSSGQSIGASASASVLPMNIQVWFPLRLTSFILLQFKRLSGVFSNTTVQKHQFFGAQPSL